MLDIYSRPPTYAAYIWIECCNMRSEPKQDFFLVRKKTKETKQDMKTGNVLEK